MTGRQSVTVTHLVAGTVVESIHTGQRVTVQHGADGLALVKVYEGGRIVRGISYRNAEIADRDYGVTVSEWTEVDT
jgi:hypothetical protein